MDLFLAYVICFGVGVLFTLVSAVMAGAFGGHDVSGHEGAGGHAEAGIDPQDMPGFSALSPTTIASFITAFGGLGMVFTRIEKTSSPWISVPLAAVGAFVIAALVLTLFRTVFRTTQASSEAHISKLIGTTGTIITPIPVDGVGELAYVSGGSRYTAPARSDGGEEVRSGSSVRITRIVGSQFYVEAN